MRKKAALFLMLFTTLIIFASCKGEDELQKTRPFAGEKITDTGTSVARGIADTTDRASVDAADVASADAAAGDSEEPLVSGSAGALSVLSTDPASNATDVQIFKVITIQFNGEVDRSSVTDASLQIKDSAGNVVASRIHRVKMSAADEAAFKDKVSFDAISLLAYETAYTVTLEKTVKGVNGSELSEPYTWVFTTGKVATPQFDPKTAVTSVAVDSVSVPGNVLIYVAGATTENLGGPNSGEWDAFVAKYKIKPDGTQEQLWISQFGSAKSDYIFGIALDSSNWAYVAGATSGCLKPGETTCNSGGKADSFAAKLNGATGAPTGWLTQLGSDDRDEYFFSITTDRNNNLIVTGGEQGPVGNYGQINVFDSARGGWKGGYSIKDGMILDATADYDNFIIAAGFFNNKAYLGAFQTAAGQQVNSVNLPLALGNALNSFEQQFPITGTAVLMFDANQYILAALNRCATDQTKTCVRISKLTPVATHNWQKEIQIGDTTCIGSGVARAAIDSSESHNIYVMSITDKPACKNIIAKYSMEGAPVWSRPTEFPVTPMPDFNPKLTVDRSGNSYISGVSQAQLDGTGSPLSLVIRFDSSGKMTQGQIAQALQSSSTSSGSSSASGGSGGSGSDSKKKDEKRKQQ